MKVIYIKKKYIYFTLIIFIVLIILKCGRNKIQPAFYLPITNRIVAIDAGHGGIDPGAVGKQGIKEDDINLAIALKLQRFIEQSGGIAVLTREDKEGLYTEKSRTVKEKKTEDLKKRKEIVESSNADIFLTIHLNSFPQSKYYGAQTFYKKGCEKSRKLANIIQEELKNVLDKENNRMPQTRDDVFLLREVTIPSVLVECGFLSNRNEEILLNDEKYQEKIAWAIYIGIMRYFNEVEANYSSQNCGQ